LVIIPKGRCSFKVAINQSGYILKLAKAKNKLLSAIPAIQPVRNEKLKRMASGFWISYRSTKAAKCMKEWTLQLK
jgi:hypothetical protein